MYKRQGLVYGKGGGLFAPEDPIIRQEMAGMCYQFAAAFGYEFPARTESGVFADIGDADAYAVASISAMQAAGIIHGREENKFFPKEESSRAEAAQIVYQLMIAIKRLEGGV